jgi:hypothetical protein
VTARANSKVDKHAVLEWEGSTGLSNHLRKRYISGDIEN